MAIWNRQNAHKNTYNTKSLGADPNFSTLYLRKGDSIKFFEFVILVRYLMICIDTIEVIVSDCGVFCAE